MGKHLAHSRTPLDQIKPQAIRYSLAKRIAIAEDVAAGYSYRDVATRHGVALATINAAVKDPQIQDIINPEVVERRRKTMAAIYEHQADMALSTLTPERWEKERALSVMIGAATATDKARLLRGESTENVSVKSVTEGLSSELELLKKRRQEIEKSMVIDAEIVTDVDELMASESVE